MATTLSPLENSTISSACMFFKPYTRAIPSPILSTRPVSSISVLSPKPRILCSMILDTSALELAIVYVYSYRREHYNSPEASLLD